MTLITNVSSEDLIRDALLNGGDLNPAAFASEKLWELWSSIFRRPPLSGAFLIWVAQAPEFSGQSELVCRVFDDVEDPGSFKTLANALISSPEFRKEFPQKLAEPLLKLSKIYEDRTRFYAVRGHALQAYAILAIESPKQLRSLRAFLFAIDEDEEGRFVRTASSVVGTLSIHTQISETQDHLERFLGWSDANSEAQFQLGLVKMREGLNETDAVEAVKRFQSAEFHFCSASKNDSTRIEAQLFYLGMGCLLKCHQGHAFPGKDDLENLRSLSFKYAAYVGHETPFDQFAGSAKLEVTRWVAFTSKLSELGKSLGDDIWLEATRVIEEELFFLLTASKTIFSRDRSGVIEQIIAPSITAQIQRSSYQLAATLKWLEDGPNNERDENWQKFHMELTDRLQSGVLRNLCEVSDPAPESDAFDNKLSANERWTANAVRAKVAQAKEQFSAKAPTPSTSAVYEKVGEYLSTCTDKDDIFRVPQAGATFFFLLDVLINFVSERKNAPQKTLCSLKYLMKEFSESAMEEHFQDDLHSYLLGQNGISLSYEPRKLGGGRADIVANSDSIQTVLELKRNKDLVSAEGLTKKFMPQASTYQATQTNFCYLGVLDLVFQNGDVLDLRDCFHLARHTPSGGETSYTVLLFRLQGARVTPSELSKRSKE